MGFSEQKQQFCAGLPDDTRAYVNAQSPKTISASIVAAKIFPTTATTKAVVRSNKRRERPPNGERPPNTNRAKGEKNKDKGLYKGNNRLSPQEMEHCHKENRCFKCGELGHAYRACPLKMAKNDKPQASMSTMQNKKEENNVSRRSMHGAKCATKIVLSCLTQAPIVRKWNRGRSR